MRSRKFFLLWLVLIVPSLSFGEHSGDGTSSRQLVQPSSAVGNSQLAAKAAQCGLRAEPLNLIPQANLPIGNGNLDDLIQAPPVTSETSSSTTPSTGGAGSGGSSSTTGGSSSGSTGSSGASGSSDSAGTSGSSSSGSDGAAKTASTNGDGAKIVAGLSAKSCTGCHQDTKISGTNLSDMKITYNGRPADPNKLVSALSGGMASVFTPAEKEAIKSWAANAR